MSHLRIVKPAEPKPRRRKWWRLPSALTPEQQDKVRAALKNLRMAYGGWAPLAEVMAMNKGHLCELANGKGSVTGELLIRACKAGGLLADAMLETRLTDAGRCTACGALRRAS